jgi:hypothetical protein
MQGVSTSGTSVNLYETTRRNIPEYHHLLMRRGGNLESHKVANDLVTFRLYPYIRWPAANVGIIC